MCYSLRALLARMAKWQTRTLQERVAARPWRFKSSSGHQMHHMQWKTLSHRQRGGLIGAALALIIVVGYFVFLIKLLIFDAWTGIAQTAGSSFSNQVGWIGIYGFLALVISGAIGMVALPILFGLGSALGWLRDKLSKS